MTLISYPSARLSCFKPDCQLYLNSMSMRIGMWQDTNGSWGVQHAAFTFNERPESVPVYESRIEAQAIFDLPVSAERW